MSMICLLALMRCSSSSVCPSTSCGEANADLCSVTSCCLALRHAAQQCVRRCLNLRHVNDAWQLLWAVADPALRLGHGMSPLLAKATNVT